MLIYNSKAKQIKEGKDMTKAKAMKHLANARESLAFWREAYVDVCRDQNPTLDLYSMFFHRTLREEKKADYIKQIAETKARISRLERIAR